ncbi:MAG: glycosyltransferase family 1 protein [Chlamydiae bacterium]|nr:glycosyltransferase family 1 protein [Chlamydiota bacterium]
MKIGIDARPLTGKLTGIGTYVYALLEELSRQDSENEYVLYAHKPLITPAFANPRFRVALYPSKVGTLGYCLKMPRLLKQDGIEVFWGTAHVLPFFNTQIRYLLTMHDLTVYRYPKSMGLYNYCVNRLLVPFSFRKADRLIAVSESTRREIEAFLGVAPLTVIHEAASSYFIPREMKKGVPYMLYVGTVEPRKNLITLLKAYGQALQEGHKLPKLVIAGKKGWKSENIYALAKTLPVEFLGYIDDKTKLELYNGADFFVYPSLYEGFGLPVLEAMQCGLPIISSNSSSLPEVVGDAGLLFDPLDEKALKEHLIALSTSSELCLELRAKSLEQARKFSWAKSAEQLMKALQELRL